jgi:DNA repair protein RecN (Recombination protein N)
MLSYIRIQNLAIIEESEISFSPGLNIITGETGAGKSILLEAIELLCGKRASADLIRSGCDRCSIEAELSINSTQRAQLSASLAGLEDDLAQDEIVLRRVIDANGKSRCFINGALTSLKQLQAVSEALLDVTRQHAQQLLLREAEHRALLDSYGVPAAVFQRVQDEYRVFAKVSKELEQFLQSSAEQADRIRRLRIEHEELHAAKLRPNERDEVEAELGREAHSETLMQLLSDCLSQIQDGEHAIERKLQKAKRALERAAELDPRLTEIKQMLDTAAIEISEVALSCGEYQSSLETDPHHLEKLRERLADVARLERKFGRPVNDLCDYAKKIKLELDAFDSGELDENSLRKKVEAATVQLRTAEAELTAVRKKIAEKLAKDVERELTQLNMKKARFAVAITPAASSLHGADAIAFTLAANPGEPFQPLAKVASGGELSRVLLVLKALLATELTPSAHVFDEIDSGIGGAVAQVVGEKLQSLATGAQVIAVTHAPQVAALAERHLAVEKLIIDGRTVSRTRELSHDDRVAHIAAMLAGKDVTKSFEESARQLLGFSAPTKTTQKKRANS